MESGVSVILPVLNAVNYIEECLNSIISQTFTRIEVLVVDSGSTDGTVQKIEDFAEKNSNVRLIATDKKSYGAQVNIGISQAKEKYIAIVEADDYVNPTGLEKMVAKAEENNADIVKADFRIFVSDKHGNKIFRNMSMFDENSKYCGYYGKIIDWFEIPELLVLDRYLWKGIYRRDFLYENNIRLNESAGAAFQDISFLYQTILSAKRIMFIKDFYYNYRKDNEGSSVYSPNSLAYLVTEFSSLKDIVENKYQDISDIMYPYFYKTLLSMVATRYRIMEIYGIDIAHNAFIEHIQSVFREGIEKKRIFTEGFNETFYADINLFIYDHDAYCSKIKYGIQGYKEKLKYLMSKISCYSEVVLWGCGTTGSMLNMILANKDIDAEITICDGNAEKAAGLGVQYAYDVVKRYNSGNKMLFIICALKYQYIIRKELVEKHNVDIADIVFYELGTPQYLLKL